MFGTGVIVFRETLEAALFVGILAASTRGILHRTHWLGLGIAAGIAGSILMACGMEAISSWADGLGQDLVSITILGLALGMLVWHCLWGGQHARAMVGEAQRLGLNATARTGSLWAVAIAVAMTVLREGAETVLFVAGLAAGQQGGTGIQLMAAFTGCLLGAAAGWLIYAGLGRLKPQRLFAAINILILMLAGNLASQLARLLHQAGWLPWFEASAWDLSDVLSNDSLTGTLLHGVIGYEATPSQLQVVFYVATVVLLASASAGIRRRASGS